MKNFFSVSAAVVLIFTSTSALAATPAANPKPDPSAQLILGTRPVDPVFNKADQTYADRHIEAKAREALKLYREIYTARPNDPDAAWRVAMGCYHVGISFTKKKEDLLKIYQEGVDAGLKAIKLIERSGANDCAACYFWYAINTVLLADTHGAISTLMGLSKVKALIEKSIEIDPRYASSGGYRLLGQIDTKLPGFFGGSKARAERQFKKAMELVPGEHLNFDFLSELYVVTERYDLARETIQKGLALPPPGRGRFESGQAVARMTERLKEIQGKGKSKNKDTEKK